MTISIYTQGWGAAQKQSTCLTYVRPWDPSPAWPMIAEKAQQKAESTMEALSHPKSEHHVGHRQMRH